MAERLKMYKEEQEDWDIVLIVCMLNGLAKTNKNFQQVPPNYEDEVRELFETARGSGPPVIVILGGDGNKWSIGGAKYYNKVRDEYIRIAQIEYNLICVSGAAWFESMVMAEAWHGLVCDGSSEVYRNIIRDCAEFAYASLQPRQDQWKKPKNGVYILFGVAPVLEKTA